MNGIYVIRENLQGIYAKYSRVIDKVVQFALALLTFWTINKNVGFMEAATSPVVSVVLAVICTFLPMNVIVIVATLLVLVHMYAVSLSSLVMTAALFLLMYIFYFRLTPKMALIVILTPLAFVFKIPYIIPVVCGLVVSPIALVATTCGTIVYYMMEYVKKSATVLESTGIKAILSESTKYLKQVFQNKEMWIIVFAFIICFFVVFTLRRASMDHAWKIAIVAGIIAEVIVVAAGNVALGVHTSYNGLIIGSIGSVIIGLILELFLFSVDYARCENLQYEDDEYYYYVKAVPKVAISSPEKEVKHINERQGTEIIDTEQVRKKAVESQGSKKERKSKKRKAQDVDQELLTQSLKKDLNL